jgi:hypothetical protein
MNLYYVLHLQLLLQDLYQHLFNQFPLSLPLPLHLVKIQVFNNPHSIYYPNLLYAEPMVQMAHPLDQTVQQPASLYEQTPLGKVPSRNNLVRAPAGATVKPQLPSKFVPPVSKPIPTQANSPSPSPSPVAPSAQPNPAISVQSPPLSSPSSSFAPLGASPSRQPSQILSLPRADSPTPRSEEEILLKLGQLRENVLMLLNEQISTSKYILLLVYFMVTLLTLLRCNVTISSYYVSNSGGGCY